MTREMAITASRILNDLDSFEDFASAVDGLINEYSDLCEMKLFGEFLHELLKAELQRRKEILEQL